LNEHQRKELGKAWAKVSRAEKEKKQLRTTGMI